MQKKVLLSTYLAAFWYGTGSVDLYIDYNGLAARQCAVLQGLPPPPQLLEVGGGVIIPKTNSLFRIKPILARPLHF
jgi:hypothetical protein